MMSSPSASTNKDAGISTKARGYCTVWHNRAVEFKDAKNIAAVRPGDTATPLVRSSGSGLGAIDVVFPVLHGPFGEDGTVQGLLKLANIPFVGAGVLGSAVGMDKDVMKRLLRDAKIPIAEFVMFERPEQPAISFAKVKKNLGLPLFVKPANLGSSVGISKVSKKDQFAAAVRDRFPLRQQDYYRGSHSRPRDRVLGSRQRKADRITAGRDRRAARLLFLQRQISR